MDWYHDCGQLFNEEVKKKLTKSFVSMYENANHLHDWYLNNIHVANTGPIIQAYSKRGWSSVQLEFSTSENSDNILLIYKNVSYFKVDYRQTQHIGILSPTGFGRCTTNVFKTEEGIPISHAFAFEGDNEIHIKCESIGYRKVINSYW